MSDDPRSDNTRSISSARSGGSTRRSAGDPELIIAARAGDGAAFAVLRERHEVAALRLAMLLTGSDEEANAVTVRAFDQARRNLERGGGPDTAFRLQILRDVAAAVADPINDDHIPQDVPMDEASTTAPRAEPDPVVRRSFLSLPERWGTVLWHTDVEQQSDDEVGLLLGMRASTVTALAARSREGLVRGYLAGQVHHLDDPTCTEVLDGLPRSARALPADGADPVSLDPTVQAHLDGCAGCAAAARTVTILTHDLGAALAVVVLGEQGIPYLEVAEATGRRTGAAAARVPARARSMRLVLVAVALVAVTAAVPALRAGAGSTGPQDALTAVEFAPSIDSATATGSTDETGPAAGAVATTGGSADPVRATATPANPGAGRATITTTGADGVPTRLAVSTTTRMGVDGVPTTLAVIPGVSGSPDTTVTGSFTAADGPPPPGFPDFSTYGPGATDGPGTVTTGTGSTATPAGTGPTVGTDSATPPILGAPTPAQTPAGPSAVTTPPATTAPGTTPGAVPPGTTPGPVTTAPVTTAPVTTAPVTTAPVTTAVAGNPPLPTGGTDPGTGSVAPSIEPSTDPTGPPSEEPSSVSPPAPAADIRIEVPPGWLIPVLRTTPSQALFLISNQTGVAIPEQQLTVTLPADIEVAASGSAGSCERQDATTFVCTVDKLSESDGLHSVALSLTAGPDSEGGTITISVTGNQASGTIAPAL